ncbi:CES2 [Mytilus edulis]|uniref:CES2 n=1 Tax=Mytilus edulis TaxID=6550 RepID=A0A8S3VP89_MYTED|nr:CES2 [Mytilus edulis]
MLIAVFCFFAKVDHSNTTMKSSLVCLIFTFLVVLISADSNADTAFINAPSGPIKGLKLNYPKTGEPLFEFRGIPFAKPPIGPLRFQKTEPLEKRKEVHDGTKYGHICMQPGIDFIPEPSRPAMSEDCLVLNVYVPRKLQGQKLSVMVWIHGGGFWIGYGHQYDGGKLAMEGNVIIRVIAQSSVVSRFVLLKDSSVEKFVAEIAEKSSCPFDDEQIFVDCLREKTADEFLKLSDVFASMPTDKMMFDSLGMPVVDHELFLEHPIKSLEDKSSAVSHFFRSLDFMAGATSNEGSVLYMMFSPSFQEHFAFNVTEGIPYRAVCDGILSPFVELWYANNSNVKDKLCKYYSAESIVNQSLKATDAWADILFNFAINKMLEYHSGGNTYQYVVSKLSPKPFGGPPPPWFKGVGHGDELLYFFNITQFLSLDEEFVLNDKDKDFEKKMISYWTSFAKTGVPYGGDGSVPWKPYNIEDKHYLDLDDEMALKSNYKPEILDLWSNQLPATDLESATPDNGQRDEL